MSSSGAPLPDSVRPPTEYVTFVLCRLLHCLPSELRREDFRDVSVLLQCLATEGEMRDGTKSGMLGQETRGTGGEWHG